MKTKPRCTQFAPAARAAPATVAHQVKLLQSIPLLKQLYDAVTETVVMLNRKRQIVFFNRHLVRFLGAQNEQALYGLRLGEALNCRYAREKKADCGTTEFCSTCGAVRAMLSGLDNKADLQECRVTRYPSGEALDLLVRATPITFQQEQFVILTLQDISHEKRRRILERIFFHDMMNTVVSLQLTAELIRMADAEALEKTRRELHWGVNMLIEEINNQKMLLAAENHDLTPQPALVNALVIIEETLWQYENYAKSRQIRLQMQSPENAAFKIDRAILRQVLGNMVKNAVEASRPGDTVTIGCKAAAGRIHFSVHNPAVMAKDVRLQLFQRSFSTKAPGRGLGTYSMKLLSERYLNGTIGFVSARNKGTTFIASYPLYG